MTYMTSKEDLKNDVVEYREMVLDGFIAKVNLAILESYANGKDAIKVGMEYNMPKWAYDAMAEECKAHGYTVERHTDRCLVVVLDDEAYNERKRKEGTWMDLVD